VKNYQHNTAVAISDFYDLDETQWTPVPNEIVDHLCMMNLGAHEARVLWCILRKTFGFHVKDSAKGLRKTSDRIALSQFEKATGLDRRLVHRALGRLAKRRIITVIPRDDSVAKTYGINFTISQWRLSSPEMTQPKKARKQKSVIPRDDSLSSPEMTPVSSVEMTNVSSPEMTTKETPKENLKESIKESASPSAFRATGCASEEDGREERPTGFGCLRGDEEREQTRKEENRRLSLQRNLMAKSRLYTDEELVTLRDKSLSELECIHGGRVLGKAETVVFTQEVAA
jgi:phage replication O-like protein O